MLERNGVKDYRESAIALAKQLAASAIDCDIPFNVARVVSVVAKQSSYLYHLSNQNWRKLEQEAPEIAIELHYYLLGLLAIRFRLNAAIP